MFLYLESLFRTRKMSSGPLQACSADPLLKLGPDRLSKNLEYIANVIQRVHPLIPKSLFLVQYTTLLYIIENESQDATLMWSLYIISKLLYNVGLLF